MAKKVGSIDFQKMRAMRPIDRKKYLQNADIIGALTPAQLAQLFPDYYKKMLPDPNLLDSSKNSIKAAQSGYGYMNGRGGSASGNEGGTYTPRSSSESYDDGEATYKEERSTPIKPAEPAKGKSPTAANRQYNKNGAIQSVPKGADTSKVDTTVPPQSTTTPQRQTTSSTARNNPSQSKTNYKQITGGAGIPKNISPDALKALNKVAAEHNVDPAAIAQVIKMESGWNKNNTTGSYNGLTQIGGETMREAGWGINPSQFKKMSEAQQIEYYGKWLDHYKVNSKLEKMGVDISKLPVEDQAAILQGTQFGPNAMGWVKDAYVNGNKNARATRSSQASALGNTSAADMSNYFRKQINKDPGQYAEDTGRQQYNDNGGIMNTPRPVPPPSMASSPPANTAAKDITAEQQKARPNHYSGKLTGLSRDYNFGSGDPTRHPDQPSVRYGSSEIGALNPHRVPGGEGYEIYDLNRFDPKIGRSRAGVVIHANSGSDLDRLYSHGCISIPKNQFQQFKKDVAKFKAENGGKAYLNINPDGSYTITAKPTYDKNGKALNPSSVNEVVAAQDKALKEGKTPPIQGVDPKTGDLPPSVQNMRVKDSNGNTRTIKEMGISNYNELQTKGGQAFSGGANDPNTTYIGSKIQEKMGDSFNRVTGQNDEYHSTRRAENTSHRAGDKLDITFNNMSLKDGHKAISEHLSSMGLEEGKDFKIISERHGTGDHVDFKLTNDGKKKVEGMRAQEDMTLKQQQEALSTGINNEITKQLTTAPASGPSNTSAQATAFGAQTPASTTNPTQPASDPSIQPTSTAPTAPPSENKATQGDGPEDGGVKIGSDAPSAEVTKSGSGGEGGISPLVPQTATPGVGLEGGTQAAAEAQKRIESGYDYEGAAKASAPKPASTPSAPAPKAAPTPAPTPKASAPAPSPEMASGGSVRASGEEIAMYDKRNKRKIGEISRGENIRFDHSGKAQVMPDRRIDPKKIADAGQDRAERSVQHAEQKANANQHSVNQRAPAAQNQNSFATQERWGSQPTNPSFMRAMEQAKGHKSQGSFAGSRFGEEQISSIS